MTIKITPSFEEIENFRVPLTAGEKECLKHLEVYLKESHPERDFEIYTQPNLFFSKPDIMVLEPNRSVWIIEVKDYSFEAYYISFNDKKDYWKVKNRGNANITSPFKILEDYKFNLMDYANSNLSEAAEDNNKIKLNRIVKTAAYFKNFKENHLREFEAHTNEYHQFRYSTILLSSDFKAKSEKLDMLFEETRYKSYQLDECDTADLRALINPGENGRNLAQPDFQTTKYASLAKSRQQQQKIRGKAGSAKTTLLAKRVADAVIRLEEPVLVACYNITMTNYLHDKVRSELAVRGRGNLTAEGVDIFNYHSLYHWSGNSEGTYNQGNPKEDRRYGAIFIDEGQDFEKEWFNSLKKDYLKYDNSEFVIFADENQNIYDRETGMEEDDTNHSKNLPITPVRGRWNVLNKDFRNKNQGINKLLNRFSKHFFDEDFIEHPELELSEPGRMKYTAIDDFSLDNVCEKVASYVKFLTEQGESVNDICVLSNSESLISDVEVQLRLNSSKHKAFRENATTFRPKADVGVESSTGEVGKRAAKMRFYRNSGPVKFSTIHSFKGWETRNVILVLTDKWAEGVTDTVRHRLVYTGLSRANNNMIIINDAGNSDYDEFFEGLKHKK